MFARYLVLPCVLLDLVLAFSNSTNSTSSSIPVSTSTLEITSFLTVTAPAATGTRNAYTNGTGLDYASSCNQAKLDWVENRGSTYMSNSTFTTSTSSISWTVIRSGWIETYGPTEVYTLCDGYPRMNASTEFKTIDTTPEKTIWSTFATQTEVYYSAIAPKCTIGARDCSVMKSEYNASMTAYSSYVDQYNGDYTGQTTWPSATYPTSPICGSPTIPPQHNMTLAPAACMYNHATIQLLYWPVSTIGNHICGNNWTTVTATPTIEGVPNTAVGFNTTFTSPTVYMVLSGAYEVGSNFATGTAINGILPMPSDSVSSMCALEGGGMGPPETMDYADFDAPIPAAKYRCQPACWTKPDYPQSWRNSAYNITATENQCSTIYDQVYRPALQVPIEEFNSFYANYTNGVGLAFGDLQCSFSPATDGIFFDPPSALQQVQSAPGPSVPNSPGATTTPKQDPQTTPASPGNTIPTALPQTTGGGNDVPQPTQPSNSDPSDGDDNNDDPADPDTPSDPGSNNDGNSNSGGSNGGSSNGGSSNGGSSNGGSSNGGSSNGGSNNGVSNDNDDDNDGSQGSPAVPTPTQGVGGIIASIIGADPAPAGQTGSSDTTQDSPDTSGPDNSNPNPSGSNDSNSNLSDSDNGDSDAPSDGDSDVSSNSGSDNVSNGDSNADSPADQPDSSPAQGVILTDTSGQTITAIRSDDNIVLPSATIAAGQGTSIDGVGSILVGSNGVQQNGQSIAYQTIAPSPSEGGESDYAINGQTYTADGSGNVVVAPGVTLTTGGAAATMSGTTYSLGAASDGGAGGLMVNGATATAVSSADDDVYAINGQTYTTDASGNVVVAPGVTLTAGGSAATVSGTTYSLGSTGGLVVNGDTATRTDSEIGSGSVSSMLPQQTANAATSLRVRGTLRSLAMALVFLAMI